MTDRRRGGDSSPGEDGVFRVHYDWSEISPSTAVVEATARASDRETTGLDTLYAALDPDALDTLIERNGPSPGLSETTVSFIFQGRKISVHSSGEIVIAPVDKSD